MPTAARPRRNPLLPGGGIFYRGGEGRSRTLSPNSKGRVCTSRQVGHWGQTGRARHLQQCHRSVPWQCLFDSAARNLSLTQQTSRARGRRESQPLPFNKKTQNKFAASAKESHTGVSRLVKEFSRSIPTRCIFHERNDQKKNSKHVCRFGQRISHLSVASLEGVPPPLFRRKHNTGS